MDPSVGQPLEQILQIYEINDEVFAKFLRGMLCIIPEDRKSAQELLSHEWLQM